MSDAPMASASCRCDACPVVLGPSDARTPDGYCGFCGARCFPLMQIGLKVERLILSPASRRTIHGTQAAVAGQGMSQLGRELVAEASVALVDALAPQLGPQFGPLLGKLARRVRRAL